MRIKQTLRIRRVCVHVCVCVCVFRSSELCSYFYREFTSDLLPNIIKFCNNYGISNVVLAKGVNDFAGFSLHYGSFTIFSHVSQVFPIRTMYT